MGKALFYLSKLCHCLSLLSILGVGGFTVLTVLSVANGRFEVRYAVLIAISMFCYVLFYRLYAVLDVKNKKR